ncbi:MAG: diguanylate cyclase [Candidatus Omnitrophica bacterium]|nr:diguanylate cyclase [Candidatus Omnitrophota bacterium]MBI3020831.1 diguanylate cyclase [Candidatus Omnitrophota bacterium]MBI3083782.1 diguanylate cyclase [Candidatus Omnitrophota bacterium]
MDDVNVLVIEDDPQASAFLEATLRQMGYKVWVVDDPKRGLEQAQGTAFAAVVTELRFAGMNGAEFAKALARVAPETSVVVMTAYAFISSAVEAMEAGAYGYITKPFNPAEVRVVLQRAVEHASLLSSHTERQQFAELSVKDSLTGVYNRRYFSMFLANKLSTVKAYTERFSILMIDLDNFKQYNDTQGHLAGDELLRTLSKALTEPLRQGDAVFRYGGEEFVALLDRADKKGALVVAERIRILVSLYTPATVSVGVSTFPDDGADGQDLIGKADAALYKAKEAGKNRVCLA